MLLIADDPLPRTDLTFLAFRLSFQETLERIVLSRQVQDGNECFGFLTEIPFLRGVAPQVQLDLLATTWNRHLAVQEHEATLIDESVIYAACETAARIAEREPTVVTHCLITGPRHCSVIVDSRLPGALRNLHLALANEGDFLLVSQFEDMDPEDAADLKLQFGLQADRVDEMFDVLGRWGIEPDFDMRLKSLATDRELVRANCVISEVVRSRTSQG